MEHPEDLSEEMEELDEPVACYACGSIIQLQDANFFTANCDCCLWEGDSCSHGVCDACALGSYQNKHADTEF